MSTITNTRGDELDVTTDPEDERIAPLGTRSTVQKSASMLRIWNTGASDVRIGINDNATDFTVATVALIPAGEDQYFFSDRNPIVNFYYATEAGSSTIKYSAY
jgi:hypothetical protein